MKNLLGNVLLVLAYICIFCSVFIIDYILVAVFWFYFCGPTNIIHQPLSWIISGVLSILVTYGMFKSTLYDLQYEKRRKIEQMTCDSRIDDKIHLN